MTRPVSVLAVMVAAGGVALCACGGASSSGSGTSGSGGGTFCQQASQAVSELAQFGAQVSAEFEDASPGATPDVSTLKSSMEPADAAIDSLDAQAPAAIASSFHTLRQAMDQLYASLQSVTSFDQIRTALAPLNTSAVQSASTQVDDYMERTCGITPEPEST